MTGLRPQPICFVEDFALILSGLWSAIALWGPKAGADQPMVAQAVKRVNRLRLRFLALVAAFRRGLPPCDRQANQGRDEDLVAWAESAHSP